MYAATASASLPTHLSGSPSGIVSVMTLVAKERLEAVVFCAEPVGSVTGGTLCDVDLPTGMLVGSDRTSSRDEQTEHQQVSQKLRDH